MDELLEFEGANWSYPSYAISGATPNGAEDRACLRYPRVISVLTGAKLMRGTCQAAMLISASALVEALVPFLLPPLFFIR